MLNSALGVARLRLGWGVRVAISMLVLAAVFYFLPLRDVLATIRKIDLGDWAVALCIFLTGHVIAALKWQMLANDGAGLMVVLRAHFAGLVANLALPGVAGGDVVRAAFLYRYVNNKTRLAIGSVADRIVDTVGLLLLAGAGLAVAIRQFASSVNLLIGVGVALVAIAVGALLVLKFHPLLLRRLPQGSALVRFGNQVGTGIIALSKEKRRLALSLALSMLVQGIFVMVNIKLASAAGVHAPTAAWFFAWPLSKLVATLPISVAGIGVREASLAGFLAPFGAAPAQVVAIGLVWQTIQIAGGLVGGLVVLLSGRTLRAGPNSIAAGGSADDLR